jgi:hypothetical protein
LLGSSLFEFYVCRVIQRALLAVDVVGSTFYPNHAICRTGVVYESLEFCAHFVAGSVDWDARIYASRENFSLAVRISDNEYIFIDI